MQVSNNKINFLGKIFISAMLMLSLAACNEEDNPTSNTTTANNIAADATEQVAAQDLIETVVIEKVIFETTAGNFTLALNSSKAPLSVANFLQYVNEGYYNGTIFHRVINNFMIQGGGFDTEMIQKATKTAITNEADNGLQNTVGSIAMARTGMPHSATSQFFINVVDNTSLNHRSKNGSGWGYAVFGEVSEGMEVIEAIRVVATGSNGGHQNVPLEPVIVNRAYHVSK